MCVSRPSYRLTDQDKLTGREQHLRILWYSFINIFYFLIKYNSNIMISWCRTINLLSPDFLIPRRSTIHLKTNLNWCLYENIIDFCLYLWLSVSDYRLEVILYGPFYWALHHCSYMSLVLKVPVVPDVVLWLVVFPGEIASRALAGDFDHGELFAVAGEITGRLAWTGICTVLLLLCCNTMKKAFQQIGSVSVLIFWHSLSQGNIQDTSQNLKAKTTSATREKVWRKGSVSHKTCVFWPFGDSRTSCYG